jgi:hypothetical protein
MLRNGRDSVREGERKREIEREEMKGDVRENR